jgi:hypothetical protein
MIGHRLMGGSLLFTGHLAESRAHYDQAIARYNPAEHRPLTMRFGLHQGMFEEIGGVRRHSLPEQQTSRNEAVERRSQFDLWFAHYKPGPAPRRGARLPRGIISDSRMKSEHRLECTKPLSTGLSPWFCLEIHPHDFTKTQNKKDRYLQAQFYRIKARRGPKKAIMAVAACIFTAIYHMLKDGTMYQDLGRKRFDRRSNDQQKRSLVKRLADLGYTVETQAPRHLT